MCDPVPSELGTTCEPEVAGEHSGTEPHRATEGGEWRCGWERPPLCSRSPCAVDVSVGCEGKRSGYV